MFRHILLVTTLLTLPVMSIASPIQHATLGNGLKVVIAEDHRSPLVMVQVWYKVGGIDEKPNNLGISHFLEHMMFKGTVRVPDNELKQLNAMYGGSLNAITNANATYYYQLYPKNALGLALELEADRMSGLLLQYKNFSTERKVVMQERQQKVEDVSTVLAFEKFKLAAYPLNAYKYPVMGYMQNLQTLQLSDLQEWYNTWYHPNNATVVIVGDVNSTEALQQVQKYFGDIPAKTIPSTNIDIQHPINTGYRHVDMDDATQVPNLYMGWNVPSLSTAEQTSEAYALLLLKYLLHGHNTARMNKYLMHHQQILAAANLEYDMLQRGDTLFTITAVPLSNINLRQAHLALLNTVNDLLHDAPINEIELETVKNIAKSQYIFQQDTLHGQALLLGALETYGLGYQVKNQFIQNIDKVTIKDIENVLNKYFRKENLTTLYLQSEHQRLKDQAIDNAASLSNQTPPTIDEPVTHKEQ